MSLGIAFEGCAVRATFQVGALSWFVEQGLGFVAAGGSSSGAIVAGALATDQVERLAEMWLALADTPLFRPRRVLRGRWPYATSHVLRGALETGFGQVRLPELDLPIAIPVTQLRRRGAVTRVLTRSDDLRLAEAIRASCFIPGPYSRMVVLDRRPTFDGAWKLRTPVDAVGELGAERVIAVVSNPQGRLRAGGLRDSGPLAMPRVDHRVLFPVVPLPLHGFSLDRERAAMAMVIGRSSAEAFAAEHEAWLGSSRALSSRDERL